MMYRVYVKAGRVWRACCLDCTSKAEAYASAAFLAADEVFKVLPVRVRGAA